MKAYIVAPVIPPGASRAATDARLKSCIEPIADLILLHLLPDPALFGMRHVNEVSKPPLPMTERFGDVDAVRLDDKASLRAALIACGDPFSGTWLEIRSLVTCRSVHYGYDGQAFICLPHAAPVIVSPDEAVISVSDQSQLLAESDWLDGMMRHED